MKRIILIGLLALITVGFAGAGGFDFHFGMGYNAQYYGSFNDLGASLDGSGNWLPFGIGAYGGLGYGFGEKKMIAIGIEPAITMGVNFGDLAGGDVAAFSNISVQGRGYLKFKPANFLTLAAFGGVVWDTYGGVDSLGSNFKMTEWAPVAGARLTLLFMYASYDVTFYQSGLLRHNLGLGVALSK